MLGGRYLMVECAVAVHGVRLQGLYLFGFDRMHGLYTASWRDSMSTWSVECSGSPSKERQDRVELQGTLVDAVSPTGRPFRVDLELRGDGSAVVVHDTVGDARVEVMRQVFTRAAAGAAQDPKAENAKQAEQGKIARAGRPAARSRHFFWSRPSFCSLGGIMRRQYGWLGLLRK